MATTRVELVQPNGEVELRARFGSARQVLQVVGQIFGVPPAPPETAVPVPATREGAGIFHDPYQYRLVDQR